MSLRISSLLPAGLFAAALFVSAPARGQENRDLLKEAAQRIQVAIQQAEAEFRKAIALDPENAAPHNNLGNLFRDLGRLEQAFLQLAPERPSSTRPWIWGRTREGM